MILDERNIRTESVIDAAKQMMIAARTAPKAKGCDLLEMVLITGDDIVALSNEMIRSVEDHGMKFFLRDGENILAAECILLIGTRQANQGLNCGYCGYDKCELKPIDNPCAFNSVDVGIAIGSACSTALDLKLDTRVMYSAGTAVQQMGWLKDCVNIFAIPISASSKNPFFDRKPKKK